MKTSAVICEYNPFHNGHKYQIQKMRENSDAVIAVMSGDFVQRGDVAIFNKYTRTKAALMSGVDLVIMLPVCFSLNTAERFSFGGVNLIDSLNVVDTIYFGSECGDIEKLQNASSLLLNEPEDISKKIKTLLSMGLSYPKARQEAFSEKIDNDILTEPNNILALEYIKALTQLNSTIIPQTIKRHKVSYHTTTTNDNFASASGIRKMILSNEDYKKFIPDDLFDIYKNQPIALSDRLFNILCYTIRTRSASQLSQICDVTEGLENRIKASVYECSTFDEMCEFIKSKRYTLAKIQRILFSILLGLDNKTHKSKCEYIRVLGMNQTGKTLLSQIKNKSNLPIITKTSDFKGYNKSFEYDMFASDLYTLALNDKNFGVDYKSSPVIV